MTAPTDDLLMGGSGSEEPVRAITQSRHYAGLSRSLEDIFAAHRGVERRYNSPSRCCSDESGRGPVVGQDTVIAALKKYTRVLGHAVAPAEFVKTLRLESDRGAVILAATMIDDTLKEALRKRMPGINSDEAKRILDYDGLAGSFGSRLKLAQALGIITRRRRQGLEIIREMRNACAHSRQETSFATPEVRDAFRLLLVPESLEDEKS